MNCVRCLSTIVPGSKFCGNCGLVVSQDAAVGTGEHESTSLQDRMILEIQAGPGSGQRFPLGSVARLGRANGNEIQLFDAEISRLHSVIYEYDQGFAIVDQDSANGTFVNGVEIAGPTWIHPGDQITIGRSRILVSQGLGQSASALPVVEGSGGKGISMWLVLGLVGVSGLFLLIAAVVFFFFFS